MKELVQCALSLLLRSLLISGSLLQLLNTSTAPTDIVSG